jgi:hypothetical protein
MEPLWSPAVATSGNQSQIRRPQEPQKHARTVAVGCHRLPEKFHGKEGVSGSSPEEGLLKAPLRPAGGSSRGGQADQQFVAYPGDPRHHLEIRPG